MTFFILIVQLRDWEVGILMLTVSNREPWIRKVTNQFRIVEVVVVTNKIK